MVVNRKVTGTAASMPGGLALGGCVSLAITLLGAVVSAYLIGNENIPEGSVGYCSMFILLLASFLGAAAAVTRIKHRRLYVCVLSAVIYYGLLIGINALFFDGHYQGMGVTALVVLAGCMTVTLLGLKGEKKGAKRRSKIKHR